MYNKLNLWYSPKYCYILLFRQVTRMGLEPMTPTLKVLCSTN